MGPIAICLWFDDQAEEAAKFYTSVFKSSKILETTRYPEAGHEIHGKRAGSVLTVTFEINGQRIIGLNGGPQFKFTEAASLSVDCSTQEEIDYYWEKLTSGGGSPGPCGWLKDRFGLSWQIVSTEVQRMLLDRDRARVERVFAAIMNSSKVDIAALTRAFEGK